jgi:energy-coupling factor transporter ATP-binding protein EcfA2
MSIKDDGRLPVLFPDEFVIEAVRCFKGLESLKIGPAAGSPIKWTIILGNNGTGKTTILELLESALPKEIKLGNLPSVESSETEASPWTVIVPNIWDFPEGDLTGNGLGLLFGSAVSLDRNPLLNPRWKIRLGEVSSYEASSEFSVINSKNTALGVYFSYWATRKMGRSVEVTENEYLPPNQRELINAEEWLAQLDYAILREIPGIKKQWKTITDALVEILPDVRGFRPATTKDFKHYIEVETDYGWVPLRQLSYGYQTMLAWIVDLAKRMIDAYPDSDTPLKESAVVLVDEIDLHLHPSWQRRIVGDLSRIFPNVQFIATSHSPLVVQSAERCNIAVLHKDGDRVHIRNYPDQSYQGWSVEEILRELMELDSTHSEAFTQAMEAFEQAIGADDYTAAHAAYQTLDRILHPESVHRKLMRMQMGGLERPAQV